MLSGLIKFGLLLIFSVVFMWLALPEFAVVDEMFHLDQITRLAAGDSHHLPNITTFIYLHQLYAWLGQWLPVSDPLNYRMISALFAGLFALVVILLVRDHEGTFDWKLAAQMWFLPVVFPYLPLVYTDIPALLLLLLCAWLMNHRHHTAAALAGALATWVRQPSLIWLGLLTLYAGYREWSTGKRVFKSLAVMLPGGLVMAAFALFFLLNDSVALGDKSHHKISLNLTNVYFMLLVAGVVFLPLVMAQSQQVWQIMRHNAWLWVCLLAGLPLYWLTFEVSHPFNAEQLNVFIRNLTLNTLHNNLVLLCVSYLFVFFSTLALFLWPMRQAGYRWLWLAMPLAVVVMPLVEQRYYMLGLALWLWCRARGSDRIEWLQLLWLMTISCALYWGIGQRWFYF